MQRWLGNLNVQTCVINAHGPNDRRNLSCKYKNKALCAYFDIIKFRFGFLCTIIWVLFLSIEKCNVSLDFYNKKWGREILDYFGL